MIELLAIQDPPPYVQYAGEAEALGRATYLAGACTAMGIIETDEVAMRAVIEDFWRRAIIARTEGPALRAALQAGSQREAAALEVIMDFGPDDGSVARQRREDQASEYVGNGCADLTLDYPEAFSIPAED